MADIFTLEDACRLLQNKFILMIGDSNMRSFYKDLLYLLKKGEITPAHEFRRSGTRKSSFCGDRIIEKSPTDTHGRDYYEIREFMDESVTIRFIFVTKVNSKHVIRELDAIEKGSLFIPHVVIINSCIWDITRWGAMQEDTYKKEMVDVIHHIRCLFPDDTLIMWTTTLPVSTEKVKGGVFIKQLEFMKHSMRFMIMEANKFAQQLCIAFEIDLLDLHYHMRFQLHRRTNDGLHWEPVAIRHMTNTILTHIALSWEKPLPGNFVGNYVEAAKVGIAQGPLDSKEEIQLDQEILQHLQKKMQEKGPTKVTRKSEGNAKDEERENKEPEDKVRNQNQQKRTYQRKPVRNFNKNRNVPGGGGQTVGFGFATFPGGGQQINRSQTVLPSVTDADYSRVRLNNNGRIFEFSGGYSQVENTRPGTSGTQVGLESSRSSISEVAQHYAYGISGALEGQGNADNWHQVGNSFRPNTHYLDTWMQQYRNNIYQKGFDWPAVDLPNQVNNSAYINPNFQQDTSRQFSQQGRNVQASRYFWNNYPTSNFPWNCKR
nr:uncharacterized protein LOC128686983 isoform X2 [Cherax quadricarinatus]